MKIKIENLGAIKQGEIELGNLTVICGSNNSGKSYLTYLIYGMLEHLGEKFINLENENLDSLITEGIKELDLNELLGFELSSKNLKRQSKEFQSYLHYFFNYEKKFFKETKVDLEITHEEIQRRLNKIEKIDCKVSGIKKTEQKLKFCFIENNKIRIENSNPDLISSELLKRVVEKSLRNLFYQKPFILPSVREGLNMFKSELNVNRNVLIDTLMSHGNKKINPIKFLESAVTKYSRPISEYIEFINGMEGNTKNFSKYNELANELGKIVGGSYVYENSQIYFKPYKSGGLKLPLNMVSSTARTMAGLFLYLKYDGTANTLIIDEPELNLHPDNQRKIARFLVKLVNKGLDIIITTHSSYIIKEINNMLLLSNDFPEKGQIMKKYNYNEKHILEFDKIKPYLVDKNKIELMEMVKEEGIIIKTFNEVLNSMNNANEDIYYSLQDHLEDKE